MDVWELSACVRGFNKANTPPDATAKPKAPSADQFAEALARCTE